MTERWVVCSENDRYEVSNMGSIRSLRYMKALKGSLNSAGYLRVQLGNRNNKFFIHRLVLSSFLRNSPTKMVNHKNGIKTDNRLVNLEWVTARENCAHARKNGMINTLMGEDAPRAKLKNKDIEEIRKSNLSSMDLSKIYAVNPRTIRDIINNVTWRSV